MQNFKIKVPGIDFELSSNQVYHIREVSDANAPDGYQRKGITKHPLPGIEESIIVPHDGVSWNTAFNEKSMCYRKENPKVAKDTYTKIKKHLLPELEVLIEGELESIKADNNKLFDEFTPFNGEGYGEDTSKYKIKGGNMLNTKNPLEFLALLWALIGRQVMPPGKENEGSYRNCSFVLEDKKLTTTSEQDKEFDKTIALSKVMNIVTNKNKKEKQHLQNVFEYVGLKIDVDNTEPKPLIATFSKWCEKGGYNNENATEFNEIFDKFEKEEDREELVAYIKLVKDIKDSKVKVERRDIFLEGKNLGSDKKQAAKLIVEDQELYKAFLVI